MSMIDSATTQKNRFIPYRKQDLVELCVQERQLAGLETAFRQLAAMLASVFHFEFHKLTEALKARCAAFDPDADTLGYTPS